MTAETLSFVLIFNHDDEHAVPILNKQKLFTPENVQYVANVARSHAFSAESVAFEVTEQDVYFYVKVKDHVLSLCETAESFKKAFLEGWKACSPCGDARVYFLEGDWKQAMKFPGEFSSLDDWAVKLDWKKT